LLQDLKATELIAGKDIGGQHRLSGSEVNKLQDCYRINTNNGEKMRKAVWVTYFHNVATEKNPQYGLCPQDS
jgi:hypothetical protein